jgi:DNA polymerase type B, organellar and viral
MMKGDGITSSVRGTFVRKVVDVEDCEDVATAFRRSADHINHHLQDRLRGTAIKFYVLVDVHIQRETVDGPVIVSATFASDPREVLAPYAIPEAIADAQSVVEKRLEKFSAMGSGWFLISVNRIVLKSGAFNPINGSSYLPTPPKIQHTFSVLNIKNMDQKCFLWAVLAHVHSRVGKQRGHACNPHSYARYENELVVDGIRWPMELRQIDTFERLNQSFSINVLGLDEQATVVPLRVSDKRGRRHEVDLLLLVDGDRSHYCLIRNINRLLAHRTKHTGGGEYFFCRYCLHRYRTEWSFKRHLEYCSTHGASKIVMPSRQIVKNKDEEQVEVEDIYDLCMQATVGSEDVHADVREQERNLEVGDRQCDLRFKNFKAQFKVPYVIYADFECYITKEGMHEPSGFCMYTVSEFDDSAVPFVYSGPDTMAKFFERIRAVQKEVRGQLNRNEPLQMSTADEERFRSSVNCESCGCVYGDGNRKVRHHCHVTGNFLAPVCNRCNLVLKPRSNGRDFFIPVVFHNLKGYDSHVILRHLTVEFADSKIDVIASNSEKYIAFQIGLLRFIDSYQFLIASLSTLVENLKCVGSEKFVHSRRHLGKHLELVTRKQIFPYEFMDSLDKLHYPELPPIDKFHSKLSDSDVDPEDYRHAQSVWNAFGMQCMKDYQNLYVMTDVLLLADVFEEFRRMSMSYYKLDPAHYYTTPGLTFQACLKHTGVTLELYSDIDMLLLTENGIRGGSAYIGCRESIANNKHVPDSFDPSEASKYIAYLDANNLYGWAMSQPLPVGDYKWLDRSEIKNLRVRDLPDDGDYGYILEVDLEYPEHLHDRHNCYPLAVEHVTLTEDHLSPAAKELLQGQRYHGTRKLVANLADKTRYVVHFRNLKLYLEEGMKLRRIRGVIRFRQSRWLESYILKNTEYRKLAKSNFEKDFFKLLNNSLYGKLMQNLRKNTRIHFVSEVIAAERQLSKHTCIGWSEINETFSVVHQRQTKIFWNKPTIVGFSILDLSKLLMYQFHYRTMVPLYTVVKPDGRHECKLRLLFTDTDSLCYEVESKDLYRDMRIIQDHLDTSEYPVTHPLYSPVNAKVIGKFKDECHGVSPLHFVGLRPKLYSLLVSGDEAKLRAKGVRSRYIDKYLRHQDYVQCLREGTTYTASYQNIRSRDHQLATETVRKVALSSFDDKRWMLAETPRTLAHGHWRIRHSRHPAVDVQSPRDCNICFALVPV